MALKKEFRLTGKDINFLTKKKQYISAGYFSFFYFKQYENLKYNQLSVHVGLKISKRAVCRNLFKRIVLDCFIENDFLSKKIGNNFFRLFVILNKYQIDGLKKQIENLNKKDITLLLKKEFSISLKTLTQKLNNFKY